MNRTVLDIADTLEAEARILISMGLHTLARQALEEARQWRWIAVMDGREAARPLVSFATPPGCAKSNAHPVQPKSALEPVSLGQIQGSVRSDN